MRCFKNRIVSCLFQKFIVLCLVAPFLSSINVMAEEPNQALVDAVDKMTSDWSVLHNSATLTYEAIDSWLPDRGIRPKYHIAKSVIGLSFLKSVIGEPVFSSGPHWSELNLKSYGDFGRYNIVFLQKLYHQLTLLSKNTILVRNIQPWYNKELREYMQLYWLAYEHAAYDQEAMQEYLKIVEIAPMTAFEGSGYSYFSSRYSEFRSHMVGEGYDFYEVAVVPSFWVRRSIDGTADQFYQLLALLLTTFDPAFAKQHVPTDTTKPCIQRSLSIIEMRRCAIMDYQSVDKELNRVYQKLREQAAHSKDFLAKLKASQRAWVKLKKADLALSQTKPMQPREHAAQFENGTVQLDFATEVTLARVAELKRWLAHITPEVSQPATEQWKLVADVTQNKGADWKNQVARKMNYRLKQAKNYAESNPEISYFFFVKSPFYLEGKGAFFLNDVVFFSGKPSYGSAVGLADAYEKQ